MCDGCRPQPDPMFQAMLPFDWEGPADGFTEPSPEEDVDVRATKPHEVSLRVVVHAEDARKAVEKMLFGYDGTGLEVLYVSAAEREEREEYRW